MRRPRSRRPESARDRTFTGKKGTEPNERSDRRDHRAAADGTEAAPPEDSFDELDDMEFLDDVDFTLDEVENKIAPLALAHR